MEDNSAEIQALLANNKIYSMLDTHYQSSDRSFFFSIGCGNPRYILQPCLIFGGNNLDLATVELSVLFADRYAGTISTKAERLHYLKCSGNSFVQILEQMIEDYEDGNDVDLDCSDISFLSVLFTNILALAVKYKLSSS